MFQRSKTRRNQPTVLTEPRFPAISDPAGAGLQPKPMGHIPEFDGLRGIAVLLVILFHLSPMLRFAPPPARALQTLFTPGWTGVDLFFILSGCLITGILLDEKGTENYFYRFYMRRALRIFPVYYLALIVCLTVLSPLLTPGEIPRTTVMAYLLNASNWLSLSGSELPSLKHYWSLAVEEQFYLVWPLAIYALGRRSILRVLIAIIVIAPLVRYAILVALPDYVTALRVITVLTPARADGLAFGALVAICLRNDLLRSAVLRWSKVALAGAGTLLLLWFGVRERFHLEVPVVRCLLSTLLGISYGLVALKAADRTGSDALVQRLLRWKLLKRAGRYSYAAYLFHFPIFWAVFPKLSALSSHTRSVLALPCFLGCIGLTFLLAKLSWWLIEAPLLRQKDLLAPAPAGKLRQSVPSDARPPRVEVTVA